MRTGVTAAAFAALLAAGCRSGGAPPAAGPDLPAPVETPAPEAALPKGETAGFTVEPGDVLAVDVFRRPEFAVTQRVPLSGAISVALIGEVRAAGRAVEEIRGEIARRLAERYLANPQVTVSVQTLAPRRVYVLGEVRTPREYAIPESGRLYLLQLLSSAGGLLDTADRREVRLIRTSREDRLAREMFRVPLHRIESGGLADVPLLAEDVVIVPAATKLVYVLGAVKSPGGYAMPPGGRFGVAQAVAMAGGLGKFASPGEVQILRQGPDRRPMALRVNLGRVLEGHLGEDCDLVPGDIIVVPTGLW